jgi:CRISPR/Cas system-associated exonuclease Cas4 (RecB family)
MKKTITKFDWLAAGECPTMAWFGLRAVATPPAEAAMFRMEQGKEVGALARQLYPSGVFVLEANGKTTAEATRELLGDASIETLFEAAFRAGPFVARADILARQDGAWHLLEVKSRFGGKGKIKELIDDIAYTAMVIKRAGQQVSRASLALLSREYRFGDRPDRLFEIVDATEEVVSRAAEFEGVADRVAQALLGDVPPTPKLVSACRSCAFFEEECLGSGRPHTVLEIPGLHSSKLKILSAAGITDLSLVPENLNLNERQTRAKYASLSGNVVVEAGLGAALESIQWPCHYLDFETVATVLPVYKGHACHQQVLTQFSIHHRDSIDGDFRHSEYLADATKDCERELAETLVDKLGDCGSVLVYSHFEETRIKALRDASPDLAERLQAIIARLRNLQEVVERHVYHPKFRGSFSIKKVLPALVPELSYAGLDIADGDTAITRFARMARGEISGDLVGVTRQRLLDYCKVDTLAMVRLHEALFQLAAKGQRAGGA